MPLQATSGAASYDAFGGGAAAGPQYIEDVFSTWLYTGNGGTHTITNGIDLAGKGGLVWGKVRNSGSGNDNHYLYDTLRGTGAALFTNLTTAQSSTASGVSAFNSNGFAVTAGRLNDNTFNYASWTFRKQPKFFDVVTYTGNSSNPRTIAHNLGSVPGCIMVKATSASAEWHVYHRSLNNGTTPEQYELVLNTTAATAGPGNYWNTTAPTSTVFSVGGTLNTNGVTYVAYLYAHDAGGFGLTGTDNVISCGSFTTDGSGNATVDLGWEPQWILVKRSNAVNDWFIVDNMRGLDQSNNYFLRPNLPDAEFNNDFAYYKINSTGFGVSIIQGSGNTVVYIAIRRGPMKVPTTGTSVFSPQNGRGATDGTPNANAFTTNFPVDMFIATSKSSGINRVLDRLRGKPSALQTSSTSAEITNTFYNFDDMDGIWGSISDPANSSICNWAFRRAPGFFDVVCYTGTGSARTVAHNLTVAPELIICKRRNSAGFDWLTYCAYLNGGVTPQNWWVKINGNSPQFDSNSYWNDTSPTSTVFSLGTEGDVNASGGTYVAYLFATCPGVSKVGSYTGNGSSQTINCGFTGGARFVMIKRTDSTGDWYVWDTARGIVAGNDPHLSLNTTAAEVTSNDTIDTDSTGFVVNQVAATNVNVNAATYIFLAVS